MQQTLINQDEKLQNSQDSNEIVTAPPFSQSSQVQPNQQVIIDSNIYKKILCCPIVFVSIMFIPLLVDIYINIDNSIIYYQELVAV